jgi:hypothetical protein
MCGPKFCSMKHFLRRWKSSRWKRRRRSLFR